MSLLEALEKAKNKLKQVETRVLRADGTEVSEIRGSDGAFHVDQNISNKRRKKVERMKRMGFVVDLKPDLQLAVCCPGLYLGSQDAAADLTVLKNGGITHIINVATGINNFFPKQFRYYKLELLDLPTTDIQSYLLQVIEYIHEVIAAGGKVFVHCNAGISRSSTFVLAYMMKYHNLTLAEAIAQVKESRPAIRPNDGFMQQLLFFESSFKQESK